MKESRWICIGLAVGVAMATSTAFSATDVRIDTVCLDPPAAIAAAYIGSSSSDLSALAGIVAELGGSVCGATERESTLVARIAVPQGGMRVLSQAPYFDWIEEIPRLESPAQDLPRLSWWLHHWFGVERLSRLSEPVFGTLNQTWDGYQNRISGFSKLHALRRQGAGVAALDSLDRITVCVIDSGLDASHEEFSKLVATGAITGESNFASLVSTEDANPWLDHLGHGTAVVGTIVSSENTGLASALGGLARVHMVKAMTSAGAVPELLFAIDRCAHAQADVITMSFATAPTGVESARLAALYAAGVVLVAASGNSGTADSPFPASSPHVISVGGINDAGEVTGFSSYQHPVDSDDVNEASALWRGTEIVAPSQNIYTAASAVQSGVSGRPGVERSSLSLATSGASGQVRAWRVFPSPAGIVEGVAVDGGDCATVSGQVWPWSVVFCRPVTPSIYSDRDLIMFAENSGARGVVLLRDRVASKVGDCEFDGPFGNPIAQSGGGACQPSIPVVAIEHEEAKRWLSTGGWYGKWVRIESDLARDCETCVGSYAAVDGTSFAAPLVAAGAAMILASCGGRAGLPVGFVRRALREGARDMHGQHPGTKRAFDAGVDPVTGWGALDIEGSLRWASAQLPSRCMW